jgi:hypothetical protein
MKSFIGYINDSVIMPLKNILVHTCMLSSKLLTSFLSDFMYAYRTVMHANINNICYCLG